MKTYVMGHYRITDESMYMEYVRNVPKTLAAYGGQTLIAEHEPTILEGKPQQVSVLVCFPSREQALQWYRSAEYQNIIGFRKNSTEEGWVLLAGEFTPRGGAL